LIAGATAASVALLVGPALNSASGATPPAAPSGQHATDASSAAQAGQAALHDLAPARNASLRQIVVSSFESANTILKQKVKSALSKMWQPGKDKSDKSNGDQSKSPLAQFSNDLAPPHS
jgi:hypothetical protein